MINRVLIRIKVVQLLYSYLLLEKQFLLESQPSSPTKEKRFAYSLYLDFLVLLVRLADRVEKRGGEKPLQDNRFIANVLSDDKIKSLLARYRMETFPMEGIEETLIQAVKDSGIYKLYCKKENRTPADEVTVWREIFNQLIAPDGTVGALASQRENYTLRGYERARELMETTFTNFFSSQGHLADALKQLNASLEKARELYFRLLMLPVELTDLRNREIDENRHKYIKTNEDINPNMRFVENGFVAALRANPEIQKYVTANKLSWLPDDTRLLSALLRSIKESDIYYDYMNFPATDFHTDCEFWRNVYKYIIFTDPDFLETLEDKSVFWNDDIDIIGTFLLKTIRRFEGGEDQEPVLPKFKDDEDARFGAELFSATVRNREIYRSYIDSFVKSDSWDAERLAFMDVVILLTAIAEIINFPKIPVNVSINEYIEIAKSYSTSKSGAFINGMLGSIVGMLQEQRSFTKDCADKPSNMQN